MVSNTRSILAPLPNSRLRLYDLVNGVAVAEPAAPLLLAVQPEAQAGRVDPPVADLAQAPYSPGMGQGICDPSQADRVGHRGEAVALFGKPYAGRLRLAGDVLVPVKHDLGAERRMPRHLDRQMPPGRIHDVKRVMVDVLGLLLQVADHPGRGPLHLPHRRLRHQDQEHTRTNRVLGQVRLGDPVLTLTGPTEDHRHPVGRTPRLDPAGEPAGHPHQMRVVQRLVRTVVQPTPPTAEPTRIVPQREVGVQHDVLPLVAW
jgi:hypothetical protein